MKKIRIKIYCVLLLTLLYTASAVLSIGPAQARFENIITESTILNTTVQSGITSNCLVSSADKPVTVLLGELPLERSTTVSFWLRSSGNAATGKLLWGVRDPAHADYLTISMLSGYDVIEPNTQIDLLEDVKLDLSMVLMPTSLARNTAHGEMKIDVLVTWGDDLWGTFQVFLPAVEDEDAPEDAAPEEDTSEDPEAGTGSETPEEPDPEDPEAIKDPQTGGDPEVNEDQNTDTGDTGTADPDTGEAEDTDDPKTDDTGADETLTTSDTENNGPEEDPDSLGDAENKTDPGQADTPTGTEDETTKTGEEKPEDSQKEENNENKTESSVGTTEDQNGSEDDKGDASPEEDGEDETTSGEDQTEDPDQPENPTETEPEGGTEPEGTEPEGTEPEGTEPEGTEPEGTEPEGTEPEGTEPEGTEPEETEPEGTEPEEEEKPRISLEALSSFDIAGGLPVKITLTPYVTSVHLGFYSDSEQTVEAAADEYPQESDSDTLAPFQDYTKFSLDGGEHYYMLYNGSTVELAVENVTELDLLLDFTHTGLQDDKEQKLAMEAYAGESLLESHIVEVAGDAQEEFQATVVPRSQLSAGEEARAMARAAHSGSGMILNQNSALEILLPMEWQDMGLEYSLERLTMTDYNTLAYVPVSMNTYAWDVAYNKDYDHHELIIQTGEALPQAGTYRLILKWSYEGICFTQSQITFFINYSEQNDYLLSSSEVPDK